MRVTRASAVTAKQMKPATAKQTTNDFGMKCRGVSGVFIPCHYSNLCALWKPIGSASGVIELRSALWAKLATAGWQSRNAQGSARFRVAQYLRPLAPLSHSSHPTKWGQSHPAGPKSELAARQATPS